jgi:ribonuclease HI
MLKDKTETGIARKKIQYYWIPAHCGIESNERADLETKQAIKDGRDSQLDLKTQWKKKGKEELLSFCQNT